MKTRINIAGALAVAGVVAALIGMVEQEAVAEVSLADTFMAQARLIDACEEAYGQGVRVKPSLAEVGTAKFSRSFADIEIDGETVVVILDQLRRHNVGKRCRVDPRTFQVLEKTEAAR